MQHFNNLLKAKKNQFGCTSWSSITDCHLCHTKESEFLPKDTNLSETFQVHDEDIRKGPKRQPLDALLLSVARRTQPGIVLSQNFFRSIFLRK
jgi:hypothetical protein